MHTARWDGRPAPRFMVTDESARLARWLRLCGADAALQRAEPLSALYQAAWNESRIIVTRNRRVTPGAFARVVQLTRRTLNEQLREVWDAVTWSVEAAAIGTRCDRCNVAVEPVKKAHVRGNVPAYVWATQQAFRRCPACDRVYWAATHFTHIRARIAQLNTSE